MDEFVAAIYYYISVNYQMYVLFYPNSWLGL